MRCRTAVLTCWETFAGRVSASQLGAIGLPELVTHDLAAYEALALALARQPDSRQVTERGCEEPRTGNLFDVERTRAGSAHRRRVRVMMEATAAAPEKVGS
jgi:predicted O-linked N-acetylglucosamine transferase (SPINDLY family)